MSIRVLPNLHHNGAIVARRHNLSLVVPRAGPMTNRPAAADVTVVACGARFSLRTIRHECDVRPKHIKEFSAVTAVAAVVRGEEDGGSTDRLDKVVAVQKFSP